MFAKSIAEHPPADQAVIRIWTRKLMTLLVFFASLSALALILHERYNAVELIKSAYAVVEDEATNVSKMVLQPTRSAPAPKADPDAPRHAALAEFLAKRYKVSQDQTLKYVQIAHAEAKRANLDPLLIMAIIAIESRYNPIAESEAGAKGLMQIMPKFHADKLAEFGGEKAVFDPESNIRVGTRILREYLSWTGNLGIALQMYAGALADQNDTYTNRVMGEKYRLQRVVAAQAGPVDGEVSQRAARRVDSPLGG